MPKFAANISTMYTEVDFADRYALAAEDGFKAVECQFPYDYDVMLLAKARETSGLEHVLLNTPAGYPSAGGRGLTCVPGREAEFSSGLEQAIEYAQALKCEQVHLLAGKMPAEASYEECRNTFVSNLEISATRLQSAGLRGLIEPINSIDVPGFFLTTQEEAHEILTELGAANLSVQMDLYHCQMMQGNVASRMRELMSGVGHVQIAGVPGRHEPNVGEMNYDFLLDLLDELGFDGWVGCEYLPKTSTREGLAWMRQAD